MQFEAYEPTIAKKCTDFMESQIFYMPALSTQFVAHDQKAHSLVFDKDGSARYDGEIAVKGTKLRFALEIEFDPFKPCEKFKQDRVFDENLTCGVDKGDGALLAIFFSFFFLVECWLCSSKFSGWMIPKGEDNPYDWARFELKPRDKKVAFFKFLFSYILGRYPWTWRFSFQQKTWSRILDGMEPSW